MKAQQKGAIGIPIQERYMISLKEASAYFHIGIKKLRRMAEDNEGEFSLLIENRHLICRPKFEEYLDGLMKNVEKAEAKIKDDFYE